MEFTADTHPIGTKVIIDMSQYTKMNWAKGVIVGYTPKMKKVKVQFPDESVVLFTVHGFYHISDYRSYCIRQWDDAEWAKYERTSRQEHLAYHFKNNIRWEKAPLETLEAIMSLIKTVPKA